jgi:hypothetical protein
LKAQGFSFFAHAYLLFWINNSLVSFFKMTTLQNIRLNKYCDHKILRW